MKRILFLGVIMSLISMIALAQNSKPDWTEDGHRGIDIEPRFSYLFGTGDANGSNMLSFELSIGKRISKNFYGGLVLGMMGSTEDGDPIIPIALENQWYWSVSNRFRLLSAYSIGFGINTAEDIKVGKETFRMPNYLITELAPAIQWGMSHSIDINLGFSIKALSAVGGSGNNNSTYLYVGPKAALNFHKADKYRTKTPVRDKGLQFTFEGGGYLPAGDVTSGGFGAWIFTYKANPHLSYGLGFRAGGTDTDAQMESKTVVLSTGKEYFHTEEAISFSGPDVFLRGQYRLNDKRLSPFASCNLGIRFNADDHGGYLANEIVEKVGDYDKSVLYISPALGLSLRTTHNSYLELKIGYELSPSLKGKTLEETTNKEVNTWTRKGVSLSAPFVMLGFTHTTGLFSK